MEFSSDRAGLRGKSGEQGPIQFNAKICKLKMTTIDVAQAPGSRLLVFVWCPILIFWGNRFFSICAPHVVVTINHSRWLPLRYSVQTQVTNAMQTSDGNDVGAWGRGVNSRHQTALD